MSEVVFCDFCNSEMSFKKTVSLPERWAVALGVEVGSEMQRGFCFGPISENSGWTKIDESHKCSVCIQEERDRKQFKAKKGVAALTLMADALKTK